jgi:hypothetical protein
MAYPSKRLTADRRSCGASAASGTLPGRQQFDPRARSANASMPKAQSRS